MLIEILFMLQKKPKLIFHIFVIVYSKYKKISIKHGKLHFQNTDR
jgi:hypothetical protein